MLNDGLSLLDGSVAQNFAIQNGSALPASGNNVGELFYLTTGNSGLYVYDGSSYQTASSLTLTFDSLNVKAAARAASTTNLSRSGLSAVDGVTLASGDRILVKNQTVASQNGIYVADTGSWTRASDFSGSNVAAGDFCFVTEGTTQGDTGWVVTTNGTITVGTTSITFAQFTGGTAASSSGASGAVQLSNGAGAFTSNASFKYASGVLQLSGAGVTGVVTSQNFSDGTAAPDLVIHGGDAIGGSNANAGTLYLRGGIPGAAGAVSPGGAGHVYLQGGTSGSNGISTGDGGNVFIVGGITGSNAASGAGGYISFQTAQRNSSPYGLIEYLRITNVGEFLINGSAGSSGQVLTSTGAGSTPTWQTLSGSGSVTSVAVSGGSTGLTTSGGPITTNGTITLAGTLVATNGGTGQNTYTVGDILSANSTSTLSKVSPSTAGRVLTSNGSGNVPSWQDSFSTNIPISSTTSGTIPLSDLGKVIPANGNVTVPASVFSGGNVVSVYNDSASSMTVTQGSGLTMRLVGSATTGNRTIAQRGWMTIWFRSATECVVSGGGVS